MFKSKKKLIAILFITLVLLGLYMLSIKTASKAELEVIKNASKEYFNVNKNFGTLDANDDRDNCFSGKTFMKEKSVESVLLSDKITNAVCHFKTEEGASSVIKWSVSLQFGDKVYCTDSDGVTEQTPGITVTPSCKG
jgi:hypothetical protein